MFTGHIQSVHKSEQMLHCCDSVVPVANDDKEEEEIDGGGDTLDSLDIFRCFLCETFCFTSIYSSHTKKCNDIRRCVTVVLNILFLQ